MAIPTLSRRQKVVLAALSMLDGATFSPVQVQKLFFLIDERAGNHIGGRLFDFKPYDYGPFDKAVYDELETLEAMGFVTVTPVSPTAGRRRYGLTPMGKTAGSAEMSLLPTPVQSFMQNTVAWIRSLSFAQLVGAIYQDYPHMRERSIFVD